MNRFLVTLALVGCTTVSPERARNHARVLAQGPPRLTIWEPLDKTDTMFVLSYSPLSIVHGDGNAYLWVRIPGPLRMNGRAIMRVGFDCSRHLESQGPLVDWGTLTRYGTTVDTITFEDDSLYDWDAFGDDVEPLYRLACTGA